MSKISYENEDYVTEAVSDDKPKGPLAGFLTSRIMITEREPLYHDSKGCSVGQMIDKRIAEMNEKFDTNQQFDPTPRPQLHAITFEFPQDY